MQLSLVPVQFTEQECQVWVPRLLEGPEQVAHELHRVQLAGRVLESLEGHLKAVSILHQLLCGRMLKVFREVADVDPRAEQSAADGVDLLTLLHLIV